jgi:hypothetical protein
MVSCLVLNSCSPDEAMVEHAARERNSAIYIEDFTYSDMDLGEFGKSYEKTKHLLDLLTSDGHHLKGSEINKVKIELAESLRASGNYKEGIAFLYEVINDQSINIDQEIMGSAFDRMAAIYYELYIHNRNIENWLDSTLNYGHKALEIATRIKNINLESSTLNIIGASHIHKNNFIEAEKRLTEAGSIIRENNMEPDLAQIANLSYVKCLLGDYDNALSLAKSCFELAAEKEMIPFFMLGLELMANAYEAMGESKKCDELREKHRELSSQKDLILESLLARQLIMNYKHNIAEEEISLLSKERYYLIGLSRMLIIGLAILSGLSVLLVFLFRQKQKFIRLRNELLIAQQTTDKLLIENTGLLLKKWEEESKILKVELASKESTLASKLLKITKQNEFLIHLLKRIKEININTGNAAARNSFKEVIDLIKNQVSEKNWEEFETMYASGNSEFIRNLNKAHPDLTSNEKRLCLLLQMNLSTKEISDITRQSCRAIEMARHRLRLKFQISREENINTYLSQFS